MAASPEIGWLYYPEPTFNIAHWAIGFTRDMKQLRVYRGDGYGDMVAAVAVPPTLNTDEEKKAWAIGFWRTL